MNSKMICNLNYKVIYLWKNNKGLDNYKVLRI